MYLSVEKLNTFLFRPSTALSGKKIIYVLLNADYFMMFKVVFSLKSIDSDRKNPILIFFF